jgi:hypothetical protein
MDEQLPSIGSNTSGGLYQLSDAAHAIDFIFLAMLRPVRRAGRTSNLNMD